MIPWGTIPTDPRETTLRGLLQELLNSTTRREEEAAWHRVPEGQSATLVELVRDYTIGVAALRPKAVMHPGEVVAALVVLELDHGEARGSFCAQTGSARWSFADGHTVGTVPCGAGWRFGDPPVIQPGAKWFTVGQQIAQPHKHDVIAEAEKAAADTVIQAVSGELAAAEEGWAAKAHARDFNPIEVPCAKEARASKIVALVDALPGDDLGAGATLMVEVDCPACGHWVGRRAELRDVVKPCCTVYSLTSTGRVLERSPTAEAVVPEIQKPDGQAALTAVMLALETGPKSQEALCSSLHLSVRAVREAIAELVPSGRVVKIRRGRSVLWELTE